MSKIQASSGRNQKQAVSRRCSKKLLRARVESLCFAESYVTAVDPLGYAHIKYDGKNLVAQVRAGTIVIVVLSLPALVGVFFYGPFVLDLFLHRRPSSRFLIPSGYVGWARVEYRVANASPLPREGKYQLVHLDNK